MKLVYVYIKKYRNIIDQEWLLDRDYDISYRDHSLNLAYNLKSQIHQADLSSNTRLDAVHMVVGKTGSGKTNLLQLVGMDEELRFDTKDIDESYFLLYQDSCEFYIELFNFKPPVINGTNVPEKFFETNLGTGFPGEIPEYLKRYIRLSDNTHFIRFHFDNGKVSGFEDAEKKRDYNTFVFNGFDRHAFADCPYEDLHGLERPDDDRWIPRIPAQFHRTALFFSTNRLNEYINRFSENSTKRSAALVIKWRNWSDRLKQHLPDLLIKSDYWTFWERNKENEELVALGRAKKRDNHVSVKNQFVHDLWTDYAIYLRKWISYILSFPEEIPKENLDYTGTNDVYQEYMDYAYEKEYGLDALDPTRLPDFEKISIKKRLEWLAMFIDRKSDRDPHGLVWQIVSDIKDIGDLLNQLDDKYFTKDSFIMPIVDMFTDENKTLIEDLFERMEQYRNDDIGIFMEELLPYSFTYISSGEYQYAKVLGGIEEFCYKLKKENMQPNVIYLLDEPETYMHPELCRCFLKELDDFLVKREGDADIQVIISTHSPLMLSDLLASQITKLDVDTDGYCKIEQAEKDYFGANIHTILSDGFFLNYSIGEHAREILQNYMDELRKISNADARTIVNSDHIKKLEHLSQVASYIGDIVIKNQMEKMIDGLR